MHLLCGWWWWWWRWWWAYFLMQNDKIRNWGKFKSEVQVHINKQNVLISNMVSKILHGFYIKSYDHFSSFFLWGEIFSYSFIFPVIVLPLLSLCCHFFQRRRKMKDTSNESVDDLSQATAALKVALVCAWKCASFYYGGRLVHYSGVLPIPIILLWGIAVGPKPSAKR